MGLLPYDGVRYQNEADLKYDKDGNGSTNEKNRTGPIEGEANVRIHDGSDRPIEGMRRNISEAPTASTGYSGTTFKGTPENELKEGECMPTLARIKRGS